MAITRVRLLDGNQIDIFGTSNTNVAVLRVDSSANLLIASGTDSNSATTRVKINTTTGLVTIAGITNAQQFLTVDATGLLTISYQTTDIASNITLQNRESGKGYGTSIQFQLGNGSSNIAAGEIQVIQSTTWSSTALRNATLLSKLSKGGTMYERFQINESGHIGINNSNPVERIDVNYGGMRFNTMPKPIAPTASINDTTNGTLNGTFLYRTSQINTVGESELSPFFSISTSVSTSIATISVPISSGQLDVKARRIYRDNKLLTTINDNTTTSYDDDGSFTPTIPAPIINSTAGFLMRDGNKNAYLPQSGGFSVGTGLLPRDTKAGYLHIATMSGFPSGAALFPNQVPYTTPMVYDMQNNALYAYNHADSTWRSTTLS